MKKIALTQDKVAIVDDEDFIFLSRINWYAYKAKSNTSNLVSYYARVKFKEQGNNASSIGVEMCHLLIDTRGKNGYRISRKNGDTLDYRKENLILIPYHTMLHKGRKRPLHKGKPFTSKYKGVCWNKNDHCWVGGIRKDGKTYYFGHSKNEEDMAQRYNEKAKELYGESAYQNKIK